MKVSGSKLGPLRTALPDLQLHLETGTLPRAGGWDEQDAVFKRTALELRKVREQAKEPRKPGEGGDGGR